MRKWGNGNSCACRTMGNILTEINSKAGRLVLVVWTTRLFSLTVGISEYGWEFQRWQDCHTSRCHLHFRVRARGGEWLDISIPASLITFHTLSFVSVGFNWTGDCKSCESPHYLSYSHNLTLFCLVSQLHTWLSKPLVSQAGLPVCQSYLPSSIYVISSFLCFPISSFLISSFPIPALSEVGWHLCKMNAQLFRCKWQNGSYYGLMYSYFTCLHCRTELTGVHHMDAQHVIACDTMAFWWNHSPC